MCVICGFIVKGNGVKAAALQAMNDAVKHRGPDDEGYFLLQNDKSFHFSGNDSMAAVKSRLPILDGAIQIQAGMGFRRLSILDLSEAGHQPMINEAGTVALTFNGQIYNYKVIRQELESKGFHFKSTTDTEVILRGYECWGKEVVDRLNGMFAFAITDLRERKVWLVRDRIGIKPLYYHLSEKDITWASEMKAILKAEWVSPSINMEGLTGNYYLQSTPAPLTCFQNIFSLKPATWIEINIDTLDLKEYAYWDVPVGQPAVTTNLADASAELDERLQASVSMQLNADVPVIAMMSGGVDSTTITAMAKQFDGDLQCYSFGIDGSGNGLDEMPQAIAMAKRLGIKQQIHMVRMDEVVGNMDADLRHYEEPYTSPEVMLKPASFLGSKGYKVLLSGNGADEVFGGYGHFLAVDQWQKRRKAALLAPFLPPVGTFLQKVKNYLNVNTGFKYYANSRASMRPYEIDMLIGETGSKFDALTKHLPSDETRFKNIYEALFYFEMKYSVGSHHVYRDDLSAMRYSVEMRYPYLDHTLVEWVARLPVSLRYNGIINKPLLRATASHYIDDINLSMPKKGFNFPIVQWWEEGKEVRAYMNKQLNLLKQRGIYNNKVIKRWEENSHTAFELSKIWQLVTTEIWMQTYID